MTSLKLSCHIDGIVVKLERLLFLCDGSETGFFMIEFWCRELQSSAIVAELKGGRKLFVYCAQKIKVLKEL